jgi:protein-disulfide isomerase/uncharacterized membrane protein
MKTRTQIALTCCLLAIIALGYLTLHWYPLNFGFAGGQSICNVNAKLDCDAVSLSSYSALAGIPLAIWGASSYAVLFFLILLGWLEWTDDPERVRRWAVLLAGACFAASIVMGVISATLIQSLCLFCVATYILSAVIFFSYRGVLREPLFAHLPGDMATMFNRGFSILLALIAIPVLTYLTHRYFMQDFDDARISQMVNESVRDWEAAPKQEFVAKPSLVMGPAGDSAKMTLVEFADFRCGHCKHASYTLDGFVKSHSDVRFEFYSFPLDGACNEKIQGSNGISCRLAEAVYCAEKEGKGWSLHHALYDVQDEVNRTGSMNELDSILSKQVAQLGLSWETLQHCIVDPSTVDAIKAQAKQGVLVNVQGTPTIFANGRQLDRAQMKAVLEAARSASAQSKVR